MKVLTVAYYEFLKYIRDIKLVGGLVLFPILLIFILGTTIEGFFSPDDELKIQSGYVNEDTGIMGSEFERFINSPEIKKALELNKLDSMEEAQKLLEEGKIDAFIHIEKDTSTNIAAGNKQIINLYGSSNVELVEGMVKYFTSTFNTIDALLKVNGTPVAMEKQDHIERVSYNSTGTMPKAIDYYSVLTMLQMLLAGAIFGVLIKTKKYESDLHIRLHSLPIRRTTITLGQLLGSILFVFGSSIVTIAFSKFVYGANWSGNILIIMGTLLLFSAISVGMGLIIGHLTTDLGGAMGIIYILILLFSTISGSISPASSIPSLNFISPNYYAKTIIFGTIYGYSNDIMITSALSLAGFGIIIFATAAFLGRRENHDNI